MSIAILPDGIGRVPFALLTRYFLQRRMFVGEAIAFVCNIGVTIPLAVNGAGAYSFAWGVLVGGVAGAVSHTCLAPFRAWPGWDRREAGTLLRFGLPLAGASLIELAVGNVDNLVVGAVLGQTALGYYLLAFRQSTWPLVYFAEAARRVSLAGFSRLVDESDVLTRAFTRGLGLLVAATVPACVGLAVYAEPVIRLLYGDRWIAAAQALSVLAVFCQLRIVLFVAYDLLVALGRSSMLAALQVLWLVALIPSLVVGARLDGIRGAAIAHTIIAGAVVIPAFLVALRRVGIPPSKVFGLCTRPLFGAVAMVLVGWPITRSVDGDVAQLALGCASVVVVYLPFVWPMRSLAPRRADPLPARVAEF